MRLLVYPPYTPPIHPLFTPNTPPIHPICTPYTPLYTLQHPTQRGVGRHAHGEDGRGHGGAGRAYHLLVVATQFDIKSKR